MARNLNFKKRFYYRLNYLKRQYIGRNLKVVTRNGKFSHRIPRRRDEVYVKKLLKRKLGERYILLNPGPVLTTDSVKNSLIQYDLCHRDEDFSNLLFRLKHNALPLFGADDNYRVLFISGSGTSGLESTLSSLVPEGAKVLVVSNGAFGERLHEILELHSIPSILLKYEWGEHIPPEDVEKAIDKHPDLWGIAMNHHETSVGLLNPIEKVGQLAHERDLIFVVDAISSLGAEFLDMKRQHIDACITSSNKCIHSVTGVSMVCVRHDLLQKLADQKSRSYYLDLYKHYRYLEDRNQTPFTPNVTSFFALDRAVSELLDEGLEYRRSVYEWRNTFLRTELGRLGFEFFLEPEDASITILTLKTPPGIEYRSFYNRLKVYGFLVYDCKPPLADEYFQIANMGDLNPAMLHDFIFIVQKVLRSMRR